MIIPLGDRVVVRAAPEETESDGGIVRPDIGVEKPVHGIVVAKGTACKEVKKGDHVLYGKYSGSEVDIDGDKVLFMCEDEILGILPAEAKVALP